MEASGLVRTGSCNLMRSPKFARRATSAPPSSVALRRIRSDPHLIISRSASAPSTWRSLNMQSIVTEEEEREEEREEKQEDFGGGIGMGGKVPGGSGGGDQNLNGDNKRIRDHYKQMLRSDPTNPLLLRNFGKFLHEVENDVKGAEEMYGRALLENPIDGDVLMLYGRLLWEKCGDKDRAEVYMDRAAEASPNDSEVLRARALFLWETDDDDDEDEEEEKERDVFKSHPLVAAF